MYKRQDYNNIYESTIDYQTYSSQTTGFDGEGQITSAIGYVANSSYTVIGDSKSAGRLYDKIGKKAKAKVVLLSLIHI